MDSMWEFQKAVYAQLTGDSTLMAMVTGVYDYVQEETAYPYITIGNITGSEWTTLATSGVQVALTVEVFTRDRGRKTAADIIQRVHELLHDANLAVTGKTLVNLYFDSSDITLGRDGLSYQGNAVFKASIQD